MQTVTRTANPLSASQTPKTIITYAEVAAAFQEMWNSHTDADFIRLYDCWQKLAQQYRQQTGG
jgi:hypothetical protein